MINRGAVTALNHLLEQQPWATERLAPFAGRCVEFRCPPLPDLRLRILETGLLEGAAADADADLVLTLAPAALPLLVARDETVLRQIIIEGSAELASTFQHLFRHLTWDIEEDLSRLVGDVIAHRLVATSKAFAAWQREGASRFAENLAEYWVEEQPLLARPRDVEKFCGDVDALRDDVARFEKRVERLESAGKT